MKNLKVVFMGTPVFSVPILNMLIEHCQVVGVVTQPDKKVGRGQKIKYSAIKEVTLANGIRVFQPINIKNEYKEILSLNPDIIITCAYGQIIPKELLETPKYKCINIHASLLPELRGGAPIHRAILKGHSRTGITIMEMAEKMDAGPIISQREIPIEASDNAGTLHNKLSQLGKDLLFETLPKIISGDYTLIKQNEREATYAWNLKKEDERINWDKGRIAIFNRIRGLNPWPVAYTTLNSKIVKIWEAKYTDNVHFEKVNGEIVSISDEGIVVKVTDGEIVITVLQLEGKRKMSVKDYLNGLSNKDELINRVFF